MTALTLFLSGGKSLYWWQEEGLLSREILLYRAFLQDGAFDRINIFTYDARDKALLAELAKADPIYAKMALLGPASGKGGALWGLKGVLRHRKTIAESAALKTNQVSGGWAAIFAALLTGRPLVFRMGYILSRRFALNGQRLKATVAGLVEWLGARIAKRIVVTSEDARRHFAASPAIAEKVQLFPTYVDTSIFAAKQDYDFASPVIAVGRMRPQKNLFALLDACKAAGVGLTLVGRGEQEAELKAHAGGIGLPVNFIPQIDNAALAGLMAEHSIFVLPSLHEGLPKVLIEAMAAGLICVGTRIPGITDLIEDGQTGYLVEGFDADGIAAAIRRAIAAANPGVGKAARLKIEEKFGLTGYARREAALFRDIA